MAGKSNHYEDAESMALWKRAMMDPVLCDHLYHVPNGGRRNVREGRRLKKMGVRPGVHDYHLPLARGIYHSLWVELKPSVKGYYPDISKDQVKWRSLMRDADNAAYIIKGWDVAIDVMLAYLGLGPGESIMCVSRRGQYDQF